MKDAKNTIVDNTTLRVYHLDSLNVCKRTMCKILTNVKILSSMIFVENL